MPLKKKLAFKAFVSDRRNCIAKNADKAVKVTVNSCIATSKVQNEIYNFFKQQSSTACSSCYSFTDLKRMEA